MSTPASATCPRCGSKIGALAACPRCLLDPDPELDDAELDEPSIVGVGRAAGFLPSPAEESERPGSAGREAWGSGDPGSAPVTIGGKYQLIRQLGVGGMAQVFLARQVGIVGFEKLVVIKQVLPHLADDREAVRLFVDEARIAADLRHPNIVTIFDIGEENGNYYIVMEYLQGESLRTIEKVFDARSQRIPIETALQVVIDVARGLHYAHNKRDLHGRDLEIVHRDISPPNIIVTHAGVAKVIDFGIAKAQAQVHHTRAGMVRGKVAYMAPEQVVGRRLDHRTDQFGLGVVLYELTVGRRPFIGDNTAALMYAVQAGTFLPPSAVREGYPQRLEAIVLRALATRPEDRYPSCDALADSLEAFLESTSAKVSPATLSRFMSRWFTRDETTAGSFTPETLVTGITATGATNPMAAVPETGVSSHASLGSLPPARGTDSNLTPTDRLFVGRKDVLAKLHELFEQGVRLVTLSGPGGIGKTRIAERFARLHLDDYSLPHGGGVWWCDLTEAQTAEDICHVLGQALGIPQRGDDVESVVAHLGHALAGRGPTLLLLDGFEHLVDYALTTLATWMSLAPEARFLVTSRELLRLDGEHPYPLPPLGVPGEDDAEASEAVELFVRRARAVRPDFRLADEEQTVVAEIVRRLDGNPLAIELAASRTKLLAVSQIRDRLSERFTLLAGSQRGVSPRRATLRGAIDWSWNLLTPAEQVALAQLSVVHGGCTMEAAEVVVELREVDGAPYVLDVVQSLADKSLLYTYEAPEDPTGLLRIGIYESIRAYAAEKLADLGDQVGPLDRHARYYVEMGTAWSDNAHRFAGEVLQQLAVEQRNLIAAARQALAREPATQATVDLALGALAALDPLLSTRGPLGLYVELLDAALAPSVVEHASAGLHGRALAARGRLMRILGRTGESWANQEAALAIAQETRDHELEAMVLTERGMLHELQGRHEDADQHYQKALAMHRGGGARHLEAQVLGSLGVLNHKQGRIREAMALYQQAIEIAADEGDLRTEGVHRGNLGLAHLENQSWAQAEANYREALQIHRKLGNRRSEGLTLGYLGGLEHQRGEFPAATDHYEEAIQMLRRVGELRFEAYFVGYLGVLHHERGDLEDALDHYRRSLASLETIGDRRLLGLFRAWQGAALAESGRVEEGERVLAAAEQSLQEVGDRLLGAVASVLRGVAEAARAASAPEAERARLLQSARARMAAANHAGDDGVSAAQSSADVRFALRQLERAGAETS